MQIIDDLFAFVIKMPTLHRLSVFRDDLVFLVYIYQRWAYRVDKKRANEFGLAPPPLPLPPPRTHTHTHHFSSARQLPKPSKATVSAVCCRNAYHPILPFCPPDTSTGRLLVWVVTTYEGTMKQACKEESRCSIPLSLHMV